MHSDEVRVIERATDLAKGFGTNMRIHFDGLSVTVSVVLEELCPSRV